MTQTPVSPPPSAARDGLHVAIIMDGNGRWATQRGRPRLFGHRAGAERVRDMVEACPDLGVSHLTIYAFSTENWKRSPHEVAGLMKIFRRYIKSEAAKLKASGARVRFIGDRTRLDPALQGLMSELEADTADNETVHLTVAINYGGRDEMVRAMKALAADAVEGRLGGDEIDEATLGTYLDTDLLPDPDLIIRTSGEARLSNFLLWQSAYAEIEFTETLWPDFTPDHLADSLRRFGLRDRRFGAVAG